MTEELRKVTDRLRANLARVQEWDRPLPWVVHTGCSYRRIASEPTRENPRSFPDGNVLHAQRHRDGCMDLSMGERELAALVEIINDTPTVLSLLDHIATLEAGRAADEARVEGLVEALPPMIGRLSLGERMSSDHYCGGSHEMADGQPVYWQERGGEYPDDIEGFCLTCAIQQAEGEAGWCDCSIRAALAAQPGDGE